MLILYALTPMLYDEGGTFRSFPEGLEFAPRYVRAGDVTILLPKGKPEGVMHTGGYFSRHTSKGSKVFPAYRQVKYQNVWENIDVIFTPTENGNLEIQIVVHPGGNPEEVEIDFNRTPTIDNNGIRVGDLVLSNFRAYQGTDEVKVYPSIHKNALRFYVPDYDPHRPLVIDPDLGSVPYARLFGGEKGDYIRQNSLAVDPSGNIFVAGYTFSADFDFGSASGYDMIGDSTSGDLFILKLNPTLQIVSATYIGDTNNPEVSIFFPFPSLCVDPSGNVFIAFDDNDFPVPPGGFRDSPSDFYSDAVILKLDNSLSTILAGTYYGGPNGPDIPLILKSTPSGNIVVAGITNSDSIPIAGGAIPNKPSPDSSDGFVAVFSNDLSTLLGSTYFGTHLKDFEYFLFPVVYMGMAVGPSGEVYVSFTTGVDTLPVIGGSPYAGGPADIYILKFSSDLSSILASTYLGGSGVDGFVLNATIPMDVGRDGSLYISFTTGSPDFPVVGGYDNTLNGDLDAFVVKFSPDLSTIQHSTLFGGDTTKNINCNITGFNEVPTGIVVDDSGWVYIGGALCYINDLPVSPSAYDTDWGGDEDGFITKFYPDLSMIRASSYYAWPGHQEIADVAVLLNGAVVVLGFADTDAVSGFPWEGYSGSPYGRMDIYLAVFENSLSVEEKTSVKFSPVVITKNGVKLYARRDGYIALEVYTPNGRRVYTDVLGFVPAGEYHIPLNELTKGVYILKVRIGDRLERLKFVLK